MFWRKYTTLAAGAEVENPKADYKGARRLGKYRLGTLAIYQPDGKYLPYRAIVSVKQDTGTTHVTGCCIGCLPVDRLVIRTKEEKPFVFEFDSEKMAAEALSIVQAGMQGNSR